MKGLKKVALASAIAAVSAGAQAELQALDDAAMGELTGQAGLTIDIETSFSIGEFQYRDQDPETGATAGGSVLIRGIQQGGNTNGTNLLGVANSSLLDNVRLTLDVAGADAADNAGLNYGFSEIGRLTAFLATVGNTDSGITDNAAVAAALAAGTPAQFTDFGADGNGTDAADIGVGQWAAGLGSDAQGTENGSDIAGVEDGDLVLHFGFTDAFQAGGGFAAFASGNGVSATGGGESFTTLTFTEARDIATRSVDYSFSVDAIALASSGYEVGDLARDLRGDANNAQDNQTTVLISNLDISGFFGPRDIHIENDGNGVGADNTFLGNEAVRAGVAAATGLTGAALEDAVRAQAAAAGQIGTGADASGDADSKITISNYFRITNLDVTIDIAGVDLEGVQINNTRGDLTGLDGTSAFGFAHSRQEIFAVKETVLALGESSAAGGASDAHVSGIAINSEFKGDIDINAIRFGGGQSIGQIFLTDIESRTNFTISAHD